MNSAEDVDPPVAGGVDERLLRAFDRVARLGIDLEDDDLSDRESAAVRAFAALRQDGGPGQSTPPPEPPVEVPAAEDAVPAPDDHEDEGPLRPDAVLRSRRFTPRDDEYGQGGNRSDGVEVEVPPPSGHAGPSDPAASGPPSGTGSATAQTPGPAPGPAPDPAPDPAAAAADAAAFEPPERTGDGYLLDVAAFGVASVAFVWPWAWPATVAVALVVGTTLSSVAANGQSPAALLRRAARHVLSWLRPRSLLVGAAVGARAALLAVVVPALVCAGWWIIMEGIDGAFVAARIGVWTHGWRVAAAAVCFVLVAGGGDTRARRVVHLRRVTGQLGATALLVLAGGVVLAGIAVIAAAPRAAGGWAAADDGLGWAPSRLQDNIDRLRDDLVSAEVHAASGCLSDHQNLTWRATYTTGNPLIDDDVVRLSAERSAAAAAPSPGQMATAAAALHNQVAPWVESIEIAVDGDTVVALDRTSLPGGRPLVDAERLVGAADAGDAHLTDGIDGFDRAVALSCSAAPLP